MNYLAERRRAEILDAAVAVAGSVGWDAFTMDQVARRARLSRALLYVYFKDKVDLMFGICERALVTLRQRFVDAVSRHRLGLDQILGIGRAYIAFSQEFPVYFDVLSRCELREVSTEDGVPSEAACQVEGGEVQALMVSVLAT